LVKNKKRRFRMKRFAVLFVGVTIVVFTFTGISYGGHGQLNVNTATEEELQLLPGIEESITQNIIDYRTVNGQFASVDDLEKVKGMNRTLLNDLKPFLVLEGMTDFQIEEYRPGGVHKETQE
jgi:competence protein ComEA